MTRLRETAPVSRSTAFVQGAVSPSLDPQKGLQFGSLTYAGQLMYAGLRQDGYDHATAYRDAKFSHGTRRQVSTP